MRDIPFKIALKAAIVTALVAGRVPAADSGAVAEQAIRPAALRAHVRFLADDLLEGRGTGTRGHEIAARYVAAHFEAIGLAPAGDAGSYFQKVPLRRALAVPERSSLTLVGASGTRELAVGKECLLLPDATREQADAAGKVVYVGFGIAAPERQHDDYAGVDVRGKVVALLSGAPTSFPADQRAYYSSRQLKTETAASRGAVGLLMLLPPEEEKRYPFPRIAAMLQFGSMTWLDAQGHPPEAAQGIRGRAVLSREGAEALFAGSPRKLDDVFADATAGKAGSLELPVEARLHAESRHEAAESPNVLGLLRGSDPVLSQEYVVLSAHLDHLGLGTPRDGDAIYNGAYDNASGTAGILEIARAMSRLPRAPRRSILFAAVTAEEKGLLGAEYFANNPTVPLRDIVASLNMDMFLSLFPVKDVVAFGAEHSSLGPIVKDLAGRLGLELAPDPFPEEVIFVRSDHYAFVQKGIPALMLSSGLKSSDPKVDGGALFRQWLGTVYHTQKDDLSQPMDFESAARIARLYMLIAERVATDSKRPTWNAGNFFGAKFGPAPSR